MRLARDLHHRRGRLVVPVHRTAVQIVEEREQLIELALTDRVELVIVADRAAHRQAQKHGAGRADAIDHVAHVDLFLDRTTLVGRDVATIEARRDQLVFGRIGQQIASQLLGEEAIERQVVPERADHPITVGPHLAVVVEVQSMGVAIARRIEPKARHVLTVGVGPEQTIHGALVGIRRRIGKERLQLRHGRRHAGQIQCHSS